MFKKLSTRLPNRPLTNVDLEEHATGIPYFRGVYMKDHLPSKPKRLECGIVNLDDLKNPGTHWVAYVKINNFCQYYDSFGNLKPPLQLLSYMNKCSIFYNYTRHQKFNSVICGHLCLRYLHNFWNKINKI